MEFTPLNFIRFLALLIALCLDIIEGPGQGTVALEDMVGDVLEGMGIEGENMDEEPWEFNQEEEKGI